MSSALFRLPATPIAPQALAFDLSHAQGAVRTAGNAMRLSDEDRAERVRQQATARRHAPPVSTNPHQRLA